MNTKLFFILTMVFLGHQVFASGSSSSSSSSSRIDHSAIAHDIGNDANLASGRIRDPKNKGKFSVDDLEKVAQLHDRAADHFRKASTSDLYEKEYHAEQILEHEQQARNLRGRIAGPPVPPPH